MADLIVSTNYESERVLKAYSDDRQQLAFVIKSVPNSTDTWFISKFALFVDKSEFETGVESDVIIQEQQTSYYVEPDGSVTISFRVVSMPEELSGLMLANSLRTVPVSVRLQYRLSNGSLWHVGKFQLNNTVILGHEYLPQIPVFSVSRTDGGSPSDEGEDATVKMQLSYAPETMTQLMALRLHYAEGRDATLADEYLVLDSQITSEEITFVLGDKFSNSVDWGFLLYFGDKYENITASSNIFKAFANMHLSGAANGGVCFGGFSKSTYEQPMFECHYPAYFYGGIMLGGGSGDYPAFRTEKKTGGKWMNGKPIYLTVIETGAKTANTMNYDVSEFDIEHYVSIRGLFYAQASYADGYVFPAPAAHMNNVNWTIQLEAMDRTTVTTGATSRTWKSGMIFIEYTKTTDEPGTGDTSNDSGGNTGGSAGGSGSGSVIYSPFEVDTGNKWIDGKTIYRIVLHGAGATGASGAVIGNLPTDFDTVVSISGTAKRTSTGTIFDNNYNYTSSSRVDTYISSDGTVYCRTAISDIMCTAIIEYTKAD